jgi:hypothetical protein
MKPSICGQMAKVANIGKSHAISRSETAQLAFEGGLVVHPSAFSARIRPDIWATFSRTLENCFHPRRGCTRLRAEL